MVHTTSRGSWWQLLGRTLPAHLNLTLCIHTPHSFLPTTYVHSPLKNPGRQNGQVSSIREEPDVRRLFFVCCMLSAPILLTFNSRSVSFNSLNIGKNLASTQQYVKEQLGQAEEKAI